MVAGLLGSQAALMMVQYPLQFVEVKSTYAPPDSFRNIVPFGMESSRKGGETLNA
jgi:hypothetical protein